MMMTQTIAVERVDHIGVRVHDLDRALAFYRVLGFDLVRRPENDDVGIIRNAHGVELNLLTCESERLPSETRLHVGAFDEAAQFHPIRHIFPEERLPWLHLGEA
jgi:catechol 2,3-dioxygenase-like lactoylglutathione lyase family enzyme